MATAVQTSQPQPGAEPQSVNPRAQLRLSGLIGALLVMVGIGVVGYAIPLVWQTSVAPTIESLGSFTSTFLRFCVQLAGIAGVIYLASILSPANPTRGLRGAIFVWVSALITSFYLARAVAMNLGDQIAPIAFAALLVGFVVASWIFLGSLRAYGWMTAIESQGWLHTYSYKRTQGLRVRRYTMIGLLLVGLSGVWVMYNNQTFGTGDLKIRVPFLQNENGGFGTISILSDVQYSLPMLMAAVIMWLSWRAVNMPTFSDFLIATEAEMNKVSWSPRKRLLQDTVVVLVTTTLLTLFLLCVDLFWGWLLSRETIGVLPSNQAKAGAATQRVSTDW